MKRAILGAVLAAAACSSVAPVAVATGDVCFRCRRVIAEPRLAAEMVDHGLVLKYRTSGCLAKFLAEHPADADKVTIFVTDFKTSKLVPPDRVRFVPTVNRDNGERDYMAFLDRAAADAEAFSRGTKWITWDAVLEQAREEARNSLPAPPPLKPHAQHRARENQMRDTLLQETSTGVPRYMPGFRIWIRMPPMFFRVVAAMAIAIAVHTAAARTLDLYFIDVEGGQSTLIVTPAGQSLLVDAGFPGAEGTFQAKPGDARRARDANRIAAAARDAGLARLDYLLITHFHADHDGGAPELSKLIPIRTFIDHGTVPPEAEQNVHGTLDAFHAYTAVRARGRRLQPKPGDRLPLEGVTAVVVSSAKATLPHALAGGGAANPACGGAARPAQEVNENPRSTGFVLQFGRFRFVDLGDLTGPPLYALFCPNDLLGPADVYVLPHHGGMDAADAALFGAVPPRVAIINNGAVKGGAPEMFASLHRVTGIEDVWQLHRSRNEGARNFADEGIANLDETTSHWIKVSAKEDGSFVVTNGRTGASKTYGVRAPSP